MTTPPNGASASPPPVLKRVVSDSILAVNGEPVLWEIHAPYPFLPETYVVIRMFMDLGCVEIYAASTDGKNGIRNCIPMSKIRFTEESMGLDVFKEELDTAVYEDAPIGPLAVPDDDDDDNEPEPGEPEEPETATADPS